MPDGCAGCFECHRKHPNAFASPPLAAAIGQSDYSPLGGASSQYFGPGYHRLDFSLFKEFRITEKATWNFGQSFSI
jgi:hypothetical protein